MFTLLTDILSGFFKLLIELVTLGFTSFSRKKGYNASFASERTLLSRWNRGFSLTGRKQISTKDSFMNCLVAGSTGSGKTQSTLLPSIFATQGSFVIHDPSGELFHSSAGFLRQKGYDIKVLHFSNAEISSGYNPMSRLKTSSDIQKLASLLVRTSLSSGKEDPFWTSSATAAISILIGIVLQQPKEFHHLHNVRHLLNLVGARPEGDANNPVDVLVEKIGDHVLFSEYQSFIALDSKLMSSIIATCKSALTIFADLSVARVTATDTIDFSDLRKKPTAIFLQNSITDQKYYSVLVSIFFEQLSSYILSRFPEEHEQNIFFLIDEFSSLRVSSFSVAFPNFRKHRAGIMAIVQDFNQVVNSYGKADAEAIRSNCFSKVYFGGASLDTANELSDILGKTTRTDANGKEDVFPLLTNDQVRMLPPNRALLICGHHPPILARMRPAFRSRRYRAYMALPAPLMKGDAPEKVALLVLSMHNA